MMLMEREGEEHPEDIIKIPPLDQKWPFLLRFPIAWFGVSIGLASQAYLWKTLARDATMHAPKQINMAVWSIAACSLVMISGTYMTKCVFYMEAVRREFGNAVRRNFFFAPWVACMFLALGEPQDICMGGCWKVPSALASTPASAPVSSFPSAPASSPTPSSTPASPRIKLMPMPPPSTVSATTVPPTSVLPFAMNQQRQSASPTLPFSASAPPASSPTPSTSTPMPMAASRKSVVTSSALTKMMMMVPILGLELKVYGQWLTGGEGRLSEVANPCTHLSVVGNFIGALMMAEEGWKEAGMFMWAVGIIHYLVLVVTLYQRLPWSQSLPKELHPVFFLFVAAPSTASVAWQAISGDFDHLSRLCFFVALFLYAILVVRLNFFRGFPFSISWWAFLYPMTSAAIATIHYSHKVKHPLSKGLAMALSMISTITVLGLLMSTIYHGLILGTLFPNDVVVSIAKRQQMNKQMEHVISTEVHATYNKVGTVSLHMDMI